MNWVIHPNRIKEVWIFNNTEYDVYWSATQEVALIFNRNDLTDPLFEKSLYWLLTNGWSKR